MPFHGHQVGNENLFRVETSLRDRHKLFRALPRLLTIVRTRAWPTNFWLLYA